MCAQSWTIRVRDEHFYLLLFDVIMFGTWEGDVA